MPPGANVRPIGMLPGLLAVVAAVLVWWQGDRLQSERALIDQQVATSARLLRGSEASPDDASLQTQRRQARERRLAIERQLADEADLEMIRARTLYDLRQRCYSVKLNCVIRLSELEAGANPSSDGSTPSTLSKLGVQRARAMVSGTLADQELTDVIHAFMTDPDRVWRINRVQLKGRAFELDIERHVRAAGGTT